MKKLESISHSLMDIGEWQAVQDSTTLSDVLHKAQPQSRSEVFAASTQDLLHTGAFKGSASQKERSLEVTRTRRMQAYMNMDTKTVSQTKGWRIRAAYRLVCYMARICGGMQGPMMLSNLLHSDFGGDPSTHPFTPPTQTKVYGVGYILKRLQAIGSVKACYLGQLSGMTYLPPLIPDHHYPSLDPEHIQNCRINGVELAEYDPEEDPTLSIWLDMYSHLSSMLRIHEGTIEEPASGVYGTVGMFSNNSARMLWPLRDELLLYEEELMLRIFDHLCKESVQRVEQRIIEELGYGRVEAVMLAKTALRYGTSVYEADLDVSKIRELKSLDIIADKASDGDDPRAQIAARKQYQLVAGMTQDSGTEAGEIFRDLARKTLEDPLD